MDRPKAVIFDRDGTLASVAWCAPTTRDPGAWAAYNAAMPFDAPVPTVVGLLRAVKPGITRIMFSGRAAGDRAGDWKRYYAMQAWIDKHNLPIDKLFMRPGGDMRQDSLIKNEMLDQILPFYDVVYAVDDRPQVCDGVWRARGIPLLQVTDPGILPDILGGGLMPATEAPVDLDSDQLLDLLTKGH